MAAPLLGAAGAAVASSRSSASASALPVAVEPTAVCASRIRSAARRFAVGAWTPLATVEKATAPTRTWLGSSRDEGARGALRGREAGGLDVGGLHRAGVVEDEHHRGVPDGHAHRVVRSRQRQHERGDRGERAARRAGVASQRASARAASASVEVAGKRAA